MKNKTTIVSMKDNRLEIMVNPAKSSYEHLENYLVNPKLDKVRGLAPHLWKIENGEVVPSIPWDAHPYDPEPALPPHLEPPKVEVATTPIPEVIVKEPKDYKWLALFLMNLLASYAINRWLR